METIEGHLYDFPSYYDLVFGSDWKAEFDFLIRCFRKHADLDVRHVFEPACGTGRLLYRLGRAGFEVSGLDLNPRAVAYCNARLRRHGLAGTAFVGDMADFRLPRPVDAAINLINSFRHLPDEAAARGHLQCVARALRRGGLFVLGLHLTPRGVPATSEERWSARRGNLGVNTRLWTTRRDLRRRREWCRMLLTVYTPRRSFRIQDEIVFRSYTWRQFRRLLAAVDRLELVETYDFTYDVGRPVKVDDTSEDVMFVLRKR